MDPALFRVITVASMAVTVVSLLVTFVVLRRERPVRLVRDLVVLAVTTGAVVLVASVTGAQLRPAPRTAVVAAGLLIGLARGSRLRARVRGGVVVARHGRTALVVWTLGVVVVQAAALLERAGVLRLGQLVSWFAIGSMVGYLLGRAWPVRRARRGVARAAAAAAATVPLAVLGAVGWAVGAVPGADARESSGQPISAWTVQIAIDTEATMSGSGIVYRAAELRSTLDLVVLDDGTLQGAATVHADVDVDFPDTCEGFLCDDDHVDHVDRYLLTGTTTADVTGTVETTDPARPIARPAFTVVDDGVTFEYRTAPEHVPDEFDQLPADLRDVFVALLLPDGIELPLADGTSFTTTHAHPSGIEAPLDVIVAAAELATTPPAPPGPGTPAPTVTTSEPATAAPTTAASEAGDDPTATALDDLDAVLADAIALGPTTPVEPEDAAAAAVLTALAGVGAGLASALGAGSGAAGAGPRGAGAVTPLGPGEHHGHDALTALRQAGAPTVRVGSDTYVVADHGDLPGVGLEASAGEAMMTVRTPDGPVTVYRPDAEITVITEGTGTGTPPPPTPAPPPVATPPPPVPVTPVTPPPPPPSDPPATPPVPPPPDAGAVPAPPGPAPDPVPDLGEDLGDPPPVPPPPGTPGTDWDGLADDLLEGLEGAGRAALDAAAAAARRARELVERNNELHDALPDPFTNPLGALQALRGVGDRLEAGLGELAESAGRLAREGLGGLRDLGRDALDELLGGQPTPTAAGDATEVAHPGDFLGRRSTGRLSEGLQAVQDATDRLGGLIDEHAEHLGVDGDGLKERLGLDGIGEHAGSAQEAVDLYNRAVDVGGETLDTMERTGFDDLDQQAVTWARWTIEGAGEAMSRFRDGLTSMLPSELGDRAGSALETILPVEEASRDASEAALRTAINIRGGEQRLGQWRDNADVLDELRWP